MNRSRTQLRFALVTNARSDYTTMFPVIRAAYSDERITPLVICGGMHMRPEFGHTYRQIEADGFEIARTLDYLQIGDDSRTALALSLAKAVTLFTEALSELEPDFVIVSGDRIENLALYTATTSLGLPVAHLCGGDITEGAFDDQVRHAMTKLSHLHFVSMSEHAARVLQMGEEPWRIHITGDAALDTLTDFKPLSREKIEKRFGIKQSSQFILSTFHPVTLGSEDFFSHFKNMLTALEKLDSTLVFSYPNVDPGYEKLVHLLEELKEKRSDTVLVKSFTREEYYSLMSYCSFIIGNSSSGIWEAPTLKTPCINIGSRQQGRKRASNVIDVNCGSLDSTEKAIKKCLDPEFRKSLSNIQNPYGSGNASMQIIKTLKGTPINDTLMVKKFFDLNVDFSKWSTQHG